MTSESKFSYGCLVVTNPAAGATSPTLAVEVAQLCARHLPPVRVARSRGPGDARMIVRAALGTPATDFRVIVAVGGDGTVLEVANGMVDAGLPDRTALLVVPAGTGNSNYRSHWGDRPWQETVVAALRAPTGVLRRLDLAQVVELAELVVLGAGAGLTATVLEHAAQQPSRGRARLAAGLVAAAARLTPYPGRVLVDGELMYEGETVLVSVGGGRHRAWQFEVLPFSVLDDGLLDVCVIGADTDARAVPDLLRRAAHLGLPGVKYRRGRRIVIESTDGEPLSFEHDGELVRRPGTRFTVDVLPGRLPVLCSPAARPVSARPDASAWPA